MAMIYLQMIKLSCHVERVQRELLYSNINVVIVLYVSVIHCFLLFMHVFFFYGGPFETLA